MKRTQLRGLLLALALVGAQVASMAGMIGAASLVDPDRAHPATTPMLRAAAPALEAADDAAPRSGRGDPLRLMFL